MLPESGGFSTRREGYGEGMRSGGRLPLKDVADVEETQIADEESPLRIVGIQPPLEDLSCGEGREKEPANSIHLREDELGPGGRSADISRAPVERTVPGGWWKRADDREVRLNNIRIQGP